MTKTLPLLSFIVATLLISNWSSMVDQRVAASKALKCERLEQLTTDILLGVR
jgi:hypothetical protein